MIAIKYQIILEEPLLVTSSEGDPNSRVSHSYIPGSSMRGLLVGLVKHQYSELALEARDLFFSGKVRYLHAYPAKRNGERALPVPLSWHTEKIAKRVKYKQIEDHAYDVKDFDEPKPIGSQFVWLDEEEALAQVHEPNLHITVHTARDRKAGRPLEDSGAVYRYEALATGQRFTGAILVEDDMLGQEIQNILQPGIFYLGGVQSAGYGRVLISDVMLDEDWDEYESDLEALEAGERLVITLLSDTILRNKCGATHTDLISALGLPVEQTEAFKKVTVAGGFNRTWGTPLNKDMALKAGTVFACKAKDKISASDLERVLRWGIGERCVEGYGRLAINWQQEDNATMNLAAYESRESEERIDLTQSKEEVQMLARRMVNRMQRRELDKGLIKAVQRLSVTPRPSNNQLGRVRVIARNALQEKDLSRISQLFKREVPTNQEDTSSEELVANEHVMRDRSLRHFESAQIDKQKLSDWLINLADNPNEVWEYFDNGRSTIALAGIQSDAKLAEEYSVRLMESVLAKAMKENGAEESGTKKNDRGGQ